MLHKSSTQEILDPLPLHSLATTGEEERTLKAKYFSQSSNMSGQKLENGRPVLSRTPTYANGFPTVPASSALPNGRVAPSENGDAVLELNDGSAYQGISFGASGRSVAGECVFQTGESL